MKPMKHRFPKQIWMVVALLLPVLAGAHVLALYRIASRLTWTLLVGFVLLVLLAHSGILSSLYPILVRRWGRKHDS
jgi:cytochrome bd-type quinol oxidase subunit 2